MLHAGKAQTCIASVGELGLPEVHHWADCNIKVNKQTWSHLLVLTERQAPAVLTAKKIQMPPTMTVLPSVTHFGHLVVEARSRATYERSSECLDTGFNLLRSAHLTRPRTSLGFTGRASLIKIQMGTGELQNTTRGISSQLQLCTRWWYTRLCVLCTGVAAADMLSVDTMS
jgi:hypothetical protein